MAQINELIPFILYFEAGVPKKYLSLPLSQLFDKAKLTGFANDPDDRGGATMCGITIATFESYCRKKGYPKPTVERLKAIAFDQWREVLKTLFWDKWQADKINNQAIANILVDWVWASGTNGIKIPQRILGVTQDGIVGPKTLAALNQCDPKVLFSKIHTEREKFIDTIIRNRPTNAKYRNGWMRRLNAITYDGLKFE